MNQPAINVPRRTLLGFFHILVQPQPARAARAALRNQVAETIAPAPEFGLPDTEACYEFRGERDTMATLLMLLEMLPSAVSLGCIGGYRERVLVGIRLTGTALRTVYREVSARQANAVRAHAATGSVNWQAFAALERVRRLLSAALGLSVPNEPAIE